MLLQRGRTRGSAERALARAPMRRPRRLQRGRTRGSAERRSSRSTCASSSPLQRGRTRGSAERLFLQPSIFFAALLQRGRTRGSAESRAHLRPVGRVGEASTGPHSWECGELALPWEEVAANVASTGPHSWECGERCTAVTTGSFRWLQRGRTRGSAERSC